MARSDGEKTEAPTPKRKKEARKEGQIAKSIELGAWLQVLVATVGIEFTARQALDGLAGVQADIQRIAQDPDPLEAVALLGRGLGVALTSVVPFGLTMVLIGVIALVCQTGLVLATKAAKPKLSKVNPIQGMKKFFNPSGYWQGVKSLIKLVVIASVAWSPILDTTSQLLDSGNLTVFGIAARVGDTALDIARTVAMVGIALAVADYSFQRWQTNKKLKMSKKEIKEEAKSQEGDPQIRGQIRRKQQEMSRNRMLAGVADATAVIVNPTHIAIAIRYAPGTGAPKVIAKGRGLIADRIREEATAHFVPIVRDVPLARTLERICRVDQTIPAELYEAVARLLAFVMQVGRRASIMGGVLENPAAATLPEPV